ncbi:MAG TPA: trehalase-like domain-containing protein, partial [Bacteroidales bacterium]
MNNLNYGVIGNCRSAALVSSTGSIDWCCLPDFDSPSVFAKILDKEKGGYMAFEVDDS